MQNEKLFLILKALSPEHFKQLHRATLSPLHDGNSTSEKTYKALSMYYPLFELSPKDIRKVYSKIFPKKAFSPRSLERCFNLLLKNTESFLLHLRIEKDDFLHEKLLSQSLKRPDLFDLFQKSQTKQHEMLEAQTQRGANYWSEKTALYNHLYAHAGHEKYDIDDDTHTQINETSDRFYVHNKIANAQILQEYSKDINPEYSNILLKEVQKAISQGVYDNDEMTISIHE